MHSPNVAAIGQVQRWAVRLLATVATALVLAAGTPNPSTAANATDQAAYDAAFDAMQRDPGNSDKALVYAEAAVKIGNLEGAIGALERLLIFNPDLPRIQFELGVLYYRLGSYTLARSYLQELADRADLPEDVRPKIKEYLAQIDQQASPHSLTGLLTAGLRYQSNATFGPTGSTLRILGLDFPLANNTTKHGDLNFFGLASANYVYDFQRADPLTVEANLTLYGAKQFRQTQFDLSLTQVDIGPRIGLPWLLEGASIRPYLVGDYLSLGGDSFLNSYGGGISALAPFTDRFAVEANFEIQDRQYPVNAALPRIEDRSGDYIAVRAAPRFALTDNQLISLIAEYDRTMAVQGYERNTQYVLGPLYKIRFGMPEPFVQPWTATLGFNRVWRNYGNTDFLVDPFDTRNDREWNVGGTLEVGIVERITALFQVQHSWVDSTIPNYAYRNFTGLAALQFTF
jgi:tetratricopeptide (TPR) repeat protein